MGDAGNNPGPDNGAERRPEVSLPGALNVGEEHQDLAGQEGKVLGELSELEMRRQALEERHQRDLAQVKAFHEMELEDIEDQRGPLARRKAGLEGEVKSQQGRVSHWKGKLRTLASKPDALRGDQLLYAAFATNGDTSRDGLDAMAAVDDKVKEDAGEIFVVLQEGNLSFGRIREDNEGLLIDTSLESDSSTPDHMERVRLPVQSYDMGGSETSYAYGWVSGNFDEPKKADYSWDPVLQRGGDDDDEVQGGGWLCKVQVEDANLHLTDPTALKILEEFDGDVEAEELLQRGTDSFMMTGEAASKFLHRFIDSRIEQISAWDSQAGATEASRWSALASRIGVAVDLTKLEKFKPEFDDI